MKTIPEEFLEYFQDVKKTDEAIKITEQLKINKNPTNFTELKNRGINLFDEHGNIALPHKDSDEEISIKANDGDTITINKRALNFISQSDENQKTPIATLLILDAIKATIHHNIFCQKVSTLDQNDDFFEKSVFLNKKIEKEINHFLENIDWSESSYDNEKKIFSVFQKRTNNLFEINQNIRSEEDNLIIQIKEEHSKICEELADLNEVLNQDESKVPLENLKEKYQEINKMINNLITTINELDNESDELNLVKKSLEEPVTDILANLLMKIANKLTLPSLKLSQSSHGFFGNTIQGSSSSSSDHSDDLDIKPCQSFGKKN